MVNYQIRRTGPGTGSVPRLGSGFEPLPWPHPHIGTVLRTRQCGHRWTMGTSGSHGSPWFCRGVLQCRFLCSSCLGFYRFQQVWQPFWIYLTGVLGYYYDAQPPRPPRLPLRIMVPIIPEPAGKARDNPARCWVIRLERIDYFLNIVKILRNKRTFVFIVFFIVIIIYLEDRGF